MDTITTMQITTVQTEIGCAPRVSAVCPQGTEAGLRLLAPVGVVTQGTSLSAAAPFAAVAGRKARIATQISTHNSMDDSDIRPGRPPV